MLALLTVRPRCLTGWRSRGEIINPSFPDDGEILGVNIDDDLHKMSRKQLCRYMDAVLPKRGFFGLQSTTKIRQKNV